MKKYFIFFLFQLLVVSGFSQSETEKGLDAITLETIKGQLGFLASDWTEGRAVGTKGAYLAADYIASVFEIYGVEPFGDEVYTMPTRQEMMAGIRPKVSKSFYQNFTLLEYTPGKEQTFALITKNGSSENELNFAFQTDFSVRTGTVGQSGKAPLVFVGYGFSDEDGKYDDFKKLDLNGKIAVILDGFPGHRDTVSEAYKKFVPEGRYGIYRMEQEKMDRLKNAGVAGIIAISPNYNPATAWAQNNIYPVKGRYYEADKRLGSYYDKRMTMPGDTLTQSVPVFSVSKRVANEIVKGTGVNFEEFEDIAQNEMKSGSGELTGKSVAFKTTVESSIIKARNVVGIIEGEKTDEFIVVGGHYDHLGKWDGWIWNGADDNASGTVGVMTIAKAFKATGKKPEKSVIFAAWTGEEKGLWGSRYFVKDAREKDMNIRLNLNYDMIARDVEQDSLKNMASMNYTKACAGIEELTKKNIDEFDINLNLSYRASDRPGGGSDHAPFAEVDIPVFYFMAAMHPDYHQPSDELDKINWEKMTNIIRIGFLNTWEFANSDEYLLPRNPDEVISTPEP